MYTCIYICIYIHICICIYNVYTASPYGLVDLQLPHRFDMRYHFHLSVSVTVVYLPQVILSRTPTFRTYC